MNQFYLKIEANSIQPQNDYELKRQLTRYVNAYYFLTIKLKMLAGNHIKPINYEPGGFTGNQSPNPPNKNYNNYVSKEEYIYNNKSKR